MKIEAEDGTVPEKYSFMQEMTRGGYPKRTEQNIIDSDGTVIFSHGKLSTGSALTVNLAKKHQRPWLYIDLSLRRNQRISVQDWLIDYDIQVLNVAGSRESKHPGIHDQVKEILVQVLFNKTIHKLNKISTYSQNIGKICQ